MLNVNLASVHAMQGNLSKVRRSFTPRSSQHRPRGFAFANFMLTVLEEQSLGAVQLVVGSACFRS